MSEQTWTVEQALRLIGQAKTWKASDNALGSALCAQLSVGRALGEEQRRRAYRLLAGYETELARLGVTLAGVVAPEDGYAKQQGTKAAVVASAATVSKVWYDADKNRLVVKSPYSLKDRVQAVGALSWAKPLMAYVGPATPAAALAIYDALNATGLNGDEPFMRLLERSREHRRAGRYRTREDLPPIPCSKTDAWTHQRQAFYFARELDAAQLDMEMGTGKSKIVVDLITDSRAESVLITCPERVVGVWPKQFRIHSGREVHVIDPRRETRNGEWKLIPISDRVALYEQALYECGCGLPHICVSNYAAAGHEPFKSWSIRQRWDYSVYDESHRLRTASGVWSRWAAKIQKRATSRLGATGTLQAQTPLDVFGQFRALDPGIFGNSETSFKHRYAIFGGFQGHEMKGMNPATEDELAAKISSITYRAGPEVLDLPPEIPDVTLTCRLSPKAMKVYKTFESELYAEVAGFLSINGDLPGDDVLEASAQNVLVKMLRCMQMTGGLLKADDGTELEIDTAKKDLLADDLEDIPEREPVVVFAKFIHDLDSIEQVAAKLGRPYAELSGRRADALSRDATLADHVVIAGVQLQAGGTGVDFTRSAFATYYSMGHSLSDYLQSRKRLVRPGQERSVRFRHLVAEGTIDEDVYAALAARESVTARLAAKVKALQEGSR